MGYAILLIEDDLTYAKFLTRFLQKEEHEVAHAATGEDGLALFEKSSPDVVLLDMMLPGMDGLETLQQLKKVDESVAVIVVTAHGSISSAVEAMRLGAMDYITKPVDPDALSAKLDQAKQLLNMRADLDYVLNREKQGSGFKDIIGQCPAMRVVYEKIEEVAKTDNTTVLITGESGTGKELVARAIHSQSARSNKPLMQIDCTSIPLSLLESELFGHERGAFTGADRLKKGLLELADSGSLLLDEIGDMDLSIQSKFLRVLQERKFRRVGGTRDLRFDVRVIAATNQDLDQHSEEGKFRRDLLYRLKVFQIELPALRERGQDILLLAESFIQKFAQSFRKPVRGLDPQARQALLDYTFPGNVRELQNIIEQAVILAKEPLIPRELLSISESKGLRSAQRDTATQRGLSLEALGDNPLQAAEQELIVQALRKSKGNKKQAAELLGISRFALQRKLEKYELDSEG